MKTGLMDKLEASKLEASRFFKEMGDSLNFNQEIKEFEKDCRDGEE